MLAPCFDWWLGAHQICFIFVFGWNNEQSLSSVSSGSEFFLVRRLPQPALRSVALCSSHAARMIHSSHSTWMLPSVKLRPDAETRAVAALLGPTSPVWLPGGVECLPPGGYGVSGTLSLPEQARSVALLLVGWSGCLLVKEVICLPTYLFIQIIFFLAVLSGFWILTSRPPGCCLHLFIYALLRST